MRAPRPAAGLILSLVLLLPGIGSAQSEHGAVKAFSREVRSIAAAVRPGVVQIEVWKKAGPGSGPRFHSDDFYEFFRRFLRPMPDRDGSAPEEGERPEAEPEDRGLGSGFIVSDQGLVLTNNHVVAKADRIKIRLGDDRDFEGKLVGTDPQTDVAVVQILKGERLPVVELGDSSQLEVGDFVLAVGSPFGFTQTVTSGIVSALGRNVSASELGQDFYQDFIQTDAAINPGNSGGPLVNDDGKVVGINSMIFTQGVAQSAGVGLAIPINLAREIMKSILKHGRVVRGQLGVKIKDLSPDLAESLGLPEGSKGVLVVEVLPDTPAAKAGLRADDVILKFDGKATEAASQLRILVSTSEVGKDSKLEIFREKAKTTVAIRIGEKKDGPRGGEEDRQDFHIRADMPQDILGLKLKDVDESTAEEMGLSVRSGVVVVEIANQDGPGANAGLAPGDVIVEWDKKPIKNLADLKKAVQASKKGSKILVRLQRKDGRDLIVIRIPG